VHDPSGAATYCHACGAKLISRDWYRLTAWHLTEEGRCAECGEACAGRFEARPGTWGARAMPIRLADYK
jgi:pyruvate formate lyase activating enzyme